MSCNTRDTTHDIHSEELPEATVSRVLDMCLAVRRDELVSLLVDTGSDERVVAGLEAALAVRGARPVRVPVRRIDLPGSEPGPQVAASLLNGTAAIELTSTFIGSSKARQAATAAGVRYLCMPGVRADTFRIGGPLDVDFDALVSATRAVADAWTNAERFHLIGAGGTDLRGSVRGRPGRALTGVAREAGQYMCPPDIESGTAPVEGSTNGVVVVDADLLFLGEGPLPEPVLLNFVGGKLMAVEGAHAERLTDVLDRLADPRMTNLAEVSLGLNPRGSVGPVAMETESTLGTAHIALGSSLAYGGTVDAPAHLDAVLRKATLLLDDRPVLVEGELVINDPHPLHPHRRTP